VKPFGTIRERLILFAVVPVFLMAVAAVFTALTVNASLAGVGALFEKNLFLKEVLANTDSAKVNLYAYMETKNSDNLRLFMHYSRLLAEKSSRLDVRTAGDEETLLERNLAALLKEFIAAGDEAVQAKRGRAIAEYGRRYDRAEELASFIRDRADALSLYRLDRQMDTFETFSANMRLVRALNAAAILGALLFGVSIILYLSLKITDPIVHLGNAAERIGLGIFDDEPIPVEGEDEIGTTAHAFNLMKRSIKNSIEEIRKKAEIERELMAEQVKNLEMSGLLRNAELAALQARVNPHFLFNTLNTGVQLAVVEEAERTRVFLERLTRLMRYSFRDLDIPVAVKEEAESVSVYFYLMSIRFPDTYDFSLSVSPEVELAVMPKMILQPLVENAVRHGFRNKSSGARVSIRAAREGEDLRIEVENNGESISEERAAQIFQAARDGVDLKGAGEGGFGLGNVIRRLRLFSGREDVLSIERAEPEGTRIAIAIPYREDL